MNSGKRRKLAANFKYDDLSRIAFNTLKKNVHAYKVTLAFYVINFDDLSRSHRCNPLAPSTLYDITDAVAFSPFLLQSLGSHCRDVQISFTTPSTVMRR
jgi:hypothetical protein